MTGEYRWHFQQVHHDLWDYDSPSPVVLFDLEIDGRERKGLAQASKTGWVYILDRTNGEPLVGIEERAVPQEPRQATSATQPFPVGDPFVPHSMEIAPEGFQLVNGGRIFTPFWTDYVIAKPGIGGGVNWPPSSIDAESGYIYVCATDGAAAFRAWDISAERPPVAQLYIGGNFGTNPMPRLVCSRRWICGPTNRMATTLAGSLLQRFGYDCRRVGIRRTQRRPPYCARLRDRRPTLGIPDGGRHELVG